MFRFLLVSFNLLNPQGFYLSRPAQSDSHTRWQRVIASRLGRSESLTNTFRVSSDVSMLGWGCGRWRWHVDTQDLTERRQRRRRRPLRTWDIRYRISDLAGSSSGLKLTNSILCFFKHHFLSFFFLSSTFLEIRNSSCKSGTSGGLQNVQVTQESKHLLLFSHFFHIRWTNQWASEKYRNICKKEN